MKLCLTAFPFIVLLLGGSAIADGPLQQGRTVAFCTNTTPVCAFMKDGSSAEMYECQAQRDQAVRILPGACWDAD